MKILIIAVQGIGNLVMALPMIGQLKGQVDFYVRRSAIPLIKNQPFVRKIFPFDLRKLHRDLLRLKKEKYDMAITIFPHSRLYSKLFMWAIGAKSRLQNESGDEKHSVYLNLDLIGASYKPYKYRLDKSAVEWARKYSGKYIGIHAGCSRRQLWKRWSLEKWQELIHLLIDKYPEYKIFFFVGADEQKIQPMRNVIQLSEELPRIIALISKCSFFIGNDSGLSHIASMLKVPQLTIFGPTDPLFVKPFSPNSHIITPRHNVIVYKTGRGFIDNPRKSVINQLTVEEVFAKVKKLMKKYRI